MTIAFTLQRYLAAKNIRYDVMAHQPRSCSMETAKAPAIVSQKVSCSAMMLVIS
jgi:hypothetical protein